MKMRRLLTVDRGNTAAKISIFEDFDCVESCVCDSLSIESVAPLVERHHLDGAVYCCVGHNDIRFIESLRLLLDSPLLVLTHSLPLPVAVDYTTPQTLGLDRVAAAAGACASGYGRVLIADAGTALTLDIVADGAFRGGNISPGLALRFRALHGFTDALPLVKPYGECPDFGHDTQTAIRSGVVNGLVAQIKEDFTKAEALFPGIRLLLCGGDAEFLKSKINFTLPVIDHDLVGKGLVAIFNHNIK